MGEHLVHISRPRQAIHIRMEYCRTPVLSPVSHKSCFCEKAVCTVPKKAAGVDSVIVPKPQPSCLLQERDITSSRINAAARTLC